MSEFIRNDSSYLNDTKLVNYSNISDGIGISISASRDCLMVTGDVITSDEESFESMLIHVIKGWIQYESLSNSDEDVSESDSDILARNWLRQLADKV